MPRERGLGVDREATNVGLCHLEFPRKLTYRARQRSLPEERVFAPIYRAR